MKPQVRPVIKAFAQVLGILAAICFLSLVASAILLVQVFRTRTEAPVPDAVAIQRLETCWPLPAGSPASLLSHWKETIWDGSIHEDWVVMLPEEAAPDLNQRTSAFLKLDNVRNTWPLPEAATAAGYAIAPTVVYRAQLQSGGSGSRPPTMTEILVWPVRSHWIVNVRHTVVD